MMKYNWKLEDQYIPEVSVDVVDILHHKLGVSSIICVNVLNLSLLHLHLLHSLGGNVHDLDLIDLDLILWQLLNQTCILLLLRSPKNPPP